MNDPLKPKDKNPKSSYSEIGPYLGLGVQLAATIIIMVFIGKWLDDTYHKSPLFLILGAVLGTFSGIYNLIKTVLDLEKKSKK